MRAPGTLIGERFRLIELIGEGGMGAVHRAEDLETGEAVAIKFIRKEAVDDRSIERFRREARFAASVQHDNVIAVRESGVTDDGTPFLVMELLHGKGLDERLHELPPPTVAEVVRWCADALAGLSAVHAGGVLHRDLKPANLFLCDVEGEEEPTLKVLDFGLSRSIASSSDAPSLTTLTATHQFLGTPYYVSPEQVRSARELDARSDLYAMGVILYEALSGRRPFDGPNASAVIAAVVADEPPSLQELRPDLPKKLGAVVHKALSRDPDDRYDSAAEMAAALTRAGRGVEELRATPQSLSRPDAVGTGPTHRVASSGGSGSFFWPLLAVFTIAVVAGGSAVWLAQDRQRGGAEPISQSSASAPTSPDAPGPYRLAGPGPFGELAMRLLHIGGTPPVAELRFQRDEEGFSIVSPEDVTAARARALSARLGATAVATEPTTEVLVPALLQTNVSLNVRSAPDVDGSLVRTLPRGTLVLAAHGRLDSATSERGGSGTWSYVAATDHDVGWSSSRFLEPYQGCVPDLAATPDAPEPALLRDATLSRRRLYIDGVIVDGFLAVARDRGQDRSFIGIYGADTTCQSLEPQGSFEVPGFVEDVLIAQTAALGEESLLLVSWHRGIERPADGVETWSAYRIGRQRPIWELRLPSSLDLPRRRRASITVNVTVGPDRERGFWPIRIRHVDRSREYFQWDGRTLARWSGAGSAEIP